MREYIRQTRSATGNIRKMVMREQFYTDNLGRIVRAENLSCAATAQSHDTTTYHYDDLHRLVRKTVNGGMMTMLAVGLSKRTDGRLSRIADSDATSTLRWDEKGRWLSGKDHNV
jgi:YD repeat-containing protein